MVLVNRYVKRVKGDSKNFGRQQQPGGKGKSPKVCAGNRKNIWRKNAIAQRVGQPIKNGGFDLVEELWTAGALEEKVLAVKLLGKIAKKDPARSLKLVELFAENIGNWAVCDAIGMQGLKPILKTHRQEIFSLAKKYNRSPDFWQRRLSLVLVEWYTRFKELHPEIKKLVKALENDQEYYVNKAIVWINKNFEKGK